MSFGTETCISLDCLMKHLSEEATNSSNQSRACMPFQTPKQEARTENAFLVIEHLKDVPPSSPGQGSPAAEQIP